MNKISNNEILMLMIAYISSNYLLEDILKHKDVLESIFDQMIILGFWSSIIIIIDTVGIYTVKKPHILLISLCCEIVIVILITLYWIML